MEEQTTVKKFVSAIFAADFASALKFINSLIASDPKNTLHLCNRAYVHLKLELYRKCIKDCDEALQIDPTLAIAYIRKGIALEFIKKSKDSHITYTKGISDSYGDVEQLILLHKLSNGENIVSALESSNSTFNRETTSKPTETATSYSSDHSSKPSNHSESRFDDSISSTLKHQTQRSASQSQQDIKLEESLKEHDIDEKQAEALVEVAVRGMVQNGTGNAAIDQRIAFGNLQVNTGQFALGIKLFGQIIQENPQIVGAYLGRGTAYALSGQLEEAAKDFSTAVQLQPTNIDALKRRAQTLSALGREVEALIDLNACVNLSKDAESYHQRGISFYKLKNYSRAVADFSIATRLEHSNKATYNYMGLCYICLGKAKEAVENYLKALSIDPNYKEALANLGQAYKEWGKEQLALNAFKNSLKIDPGYANCYYLRGLTHFGIGLHKLALKDFESASNLDPSSFEAKWMKAVTKSGLGMVVSAANDFDIALKIKPNHASWYQKQIALFYHHHMDKNLATFNIDQALDPVFKEWWCKRNPPSQSLRQTQSQPMPSKKISDVDINTVPQWIKDQRTQELIQFADEVGKWMHQDAPGFLKNRRQLKMAGFAAVEIAQTLRRVWNTKNAAGNTTGNTSGNTENNKGNNKANNAKATFELDGKSSSGPKPGRHEFGWRDLFDIAVKWRQYSEPNDPVWWVDMLTPDQFNEGFGSHTPIITGQCKVIRYGRMFERSLPTFKALMKQQCVLTAPMLENLEKAQTVEELYNIMKKDFWVVTPCHSVATPGKIMDGTRLTLQASPPEGFEYSIRTPGTPPRWVDYDFELAHAFEQLSNEVKKPNPDQDVITNLILTMTFYWYNFMPLARGTAATGYLSMLGLFLACGIHLQAKIPQDVLLDWDGILLPTPNEFIKTCESWLLPYRNNCDMKKFDDLPQVKDTVPTLRHLFTLLNYTTEE